MCVCVYAFFFLLLFLTLLVKVSGAFLAAQQKNSSANARDAGLTPGSGRFPGEGNGNPVQYSCWENPMDRGAWWATYSPWDRKVSDMTERLTLRGLPLRHDL